MDLATLFVRFKADTSDVDKGIAGMESKSKKAGNNIAKNLAAAFSAAAIGAGIKKSIDAASDLNETVSKTEVIFGSASKAIENQGDTAAKSMGLSKTAYLDAASGLKGLLDNLGLTSDASTKWSTDLVKLGSDLGSFFNKDPAEAIAAIQSALRGESEPIRAFNVNISDAAVKAEALKEGLYDGVGAIDANGRAQATLALIMQQTTAAQGDFSRTADGAANSQRVAKAEAENAAASFGQVLLPVYTKVVQVVGDLAKVFGDLPGPVQTVIIALIGLVALSGPISSMIEVAGGLKAAFEGLSASTLGIGALIAVVAGLAFVLSSSDDSHAQVAARSKEVATNLAKETDEIAKQRQEAGQGATAVQGYADAQLALSNAITGSDEKGQRLAKALGGLGLQTKDAAKFAALLQVASGDAAQSQATLAGATADGGDASVLAAISQRDLAVAMLEQKGISADVARVLVEAGQGASYMGTAADSTKDKTKGWTVENKALFASIEEVGKQAGGVDFNLAAQGSLNAAVATNQFNASLVAQAEAQAGVSRNSDHATSVLAAYQTILDNLTPAQEKLHEATGDSATAAIEAATAINDLGLQTDALTATTDVAADATARLAVEQDQAKANAAANADATAKLSKSLDDTSGSASAASKAADSLDKALKRVFGGAIDLEDANRNLIAGFDGINTSVTEAKKNHDKLATSLDISTESGRKNREMVESQVKAITDQAKANVANGASVDDATAATNLYRNQLADTLTQLGFNTDEVNAYIDQLGLTPENVATAVQLTHDDEVKGRLQDLLKQLGDIDAGAAAKIQAEIDHGDFDAAEAALNQLARARQVQFNPAVIGSGKSATTAGRTASGRFARGGSNILTTFAERPGRAGDEVAFPLGDPNRIRELWDGNDVGSRILDALGARQDVATTSATVNVAPTAASTSSTVTALHVDHLEIHDSTSAQSLAQIVAFKLAGV